MDNNRRKFMQHFVTATIAGPSRILTSGAICTAAGIVIPGAALIALPRPANAEPFTLILLGGTLAALGRAVLNWQKAKEEELAAKENWELNRTPVVDYHDRFKSPIVLKSGQRFSEQGKEGGVNALDGFVKTNTLSALAAEKPFKQDISPFEAHAALNSGYPNMMYPMTSRLEPNAETTKKLQEAYATMGGTLGISKGKYVRFFSDAAGEKAVYMTPGMKDGVEHMLVVPVPNGG